MLDIIRLSAALLISFGIPSTDSFMAFEAMYKQAKGIRLVRIFLNLEHF